MKSWLRCAAWAALAWLAAGVAGALDPAPPSGSWRQRYLLGPGDILNFSFYGRSELTREAVFVQPDGTISYLQAQGIVAEGRTIDELRAAVYRGRMGKICSIRSQPREL